MLSAAAKRWRTLRPHALRIAGCVALNLVVAEAMIASSNWLSRSHANAGRLPDVLLDRVPAVDALWLTDAFVNVSAAAMIAHALLCSERPGGTVPHLSLAISVSHVLRLYVECFYSLLTHRVSMTVTTLPDPRRTCERIHTNAFTTLTAHRCGDCVFSGHALMLTLACVYWLSQSSVPGFVLSLLALVGGIAAIVANHTHYTVDIVVAVYTAVGVWYSVAHVLEWAGWLERHAQRATLLPVHKCAGSPMMDVMAA